LLTRHTSVKMDGVSKAFLLLVFVVCATNNVVYAEFDDIFQEENSYYLDGIAASVCSQARFSKPEDGNIFNGYVFPVRKNCEADGELTCLQLCQSAKVKTQPNPEVGFPSIFGCADSIHIHNSDLGNQEERPMVRRYNSCDPSGCLHLNYCCCTLKSGDHSTDALSFLD